MMIKKYFFLIFILLITACGQVEITPSAFDIQTAIAETQVAKPRATVELPIATATAMPAVTETPIPLPTPTSIEPVIGYINVAFLNLRSGPGTFFDVIGTFGDGTEVKILGKLENSFWVKVSVFEEEEDAEILGWMSGDLLDIELTDIPNLAFESDQKIEGQINLVSGEPVDNVKVTLVFRINEDELRHEATSNGEGFFIAYYPHDMVGIFDVQITSILCSSSLLNENCKLTDYLKLDSRVFITIPQVEEIQFYYEASTAILNGTIVDNNGSLVSDMVVVAVRDDGAESSGVTNSDGEFSIPIGEGIWEVYALIVYPRNEGERINLNITNQIPEVIELLSP